MLSYWGDLPKSSSVVVRILCRPALTSPGSLVAYLAASQLRCAIGCFPRAPMGMFEVVDAPIISRGWARVSRRGVRRSGWIGYDLSLQLAADLRTRLGMHGCRLAARSAAIHPPFFSHASRVGVLHRLERSRAAGLAIPSLGHVAQTRPPIRAALPGPWAARSGHR